MGIPYKPTQLPSVKRLDFAVNSWQGINKVDGNLSKGEMKQCYNMTSDNYPYASPRKSRETVANGLINPSKIFDDENKLGYIADGKFYYDGVEKGTCGDTSSVIVYDNNIFAYPSNIKYDIASNTFTTITNSQTIESGYYGQTGLEYSNGNNVEYYDGPNYSAYASMFRLSSPLDVTGLTSVTITNTGLKSEYTSSSYYYSGARLFLACVNSDGEYLYGNNDRKLHDCDFGNITLPTGAVTLYVNIGYYYHNVNYGNPTAYSSDRDDDIDKFSTSPATASISVSGTSYPSAGTIPKIDYATEFGNRIFAVEGNNIYACSLGDFSLWTNTVDDNGNPNATGAWVTNVGSPARFNGIVTYKNHVVCTKEDYIYEIYGDRPPFRVQEICKTGCIDGRSICEVNSVLYWLGRNGINAYTGGQPRVISQKLNKTYINGVGGTDGRKYYCSLYDGTAWELAVYDTLNGLWHIEDFTEIKDFTLYDGYLHALTVNGDILKFNSGDEQVAWSFETQDYTFGIPNTKNISKVFIRTQMSPNTSLDVYARINNGDYSLVASYQADDLTMYDFKVRLKKCDTFSLKFEGIGDVRILDIHASVTVGTDKHRSGDNLQVFRG